MSSMPQEQAALLDPFGGHPDRWRLDGAMRALQTLAATGRDFVLDELREPPYALPEPHHANQWGSLAAVARRAGVITPVGYAASKVPSRRGSVVRVWRRAGAA